MTKKVTDAKFEVINGPAPKPPWWRRYRLYFAKGTLEVALLSGLIAALAAAAARH